MILWLMTGQLGELCLFGHGHESLAGNGVHVASLGFVQIPSHVFISHKDEKVGLISENFDRTPVFGEKIGDREIIDGLGLSRSHNSVDIFTGNLFLAGVWRRIQGAFKGNYRCAKRITFDYPNCTSMICHAESIASILVDSHKINPSPFYVDGVRRLFFNREVGEYGEDGVDQSNYTYDVFAMRHKWANFCLGCLLMICAGLCFRCAASMYFNGGGLAFIAWIVIGAPLWIVGTGMCWHTY
jgi:hypothetical protein